MGGIKFNIDLGQYLPKHKGFDFMRAVPVLAALAQRVAQVDADHDGTKTGPEKMDAAEDGINIVMDAFPEFAPKMADPVKRRRVLSKLVDLLNEFVK